MDSITNLNIMVEVNTKELQENDKTIQSQRDKIEQLKMYLSEKQDNLLSWYTILKNV